MLKDDKVIVVVAPVGALTFVEKAPNLPITPEEIAEEAYKAYEKGASLVHIHSRDPKTKMSTPDLKVFNEIVKQVKKRCDMITEIGGGLGVWYDPVSGKPTMPTDQQKLALLNIVPKPDMLTVNLGTFDFVLRGYGWQTFDNTPDFQKKVIKGIIEKKMGMEFEIYDVSHLYNADRLADEKVFDRNMPGLHLDYVMGISGGMPATPRQLIYMVEEGKRLFPRASWATLGVGRNEFPMITMGLIMGCEAIRVGFEDNLYLSKGVYARGNAELVEKAVRIARELGREPATVDEAREMLHLSS